jgi:diguanylate cyclase (GGDEF)-like protein
MNSVKLLSMQILEQTEPMDIVTGRESAPEDFKILVADDSPLDRKVLEHTLGREKYAVFVAKSGREALDLFVKHKPNLVITDWVMPDLTGIELAKRIRNEFHEAYTYIIILTGMSDKNEVVKGLAAGADDYLTKPFHPDELLARVGVARRIHALHSQIEAKNRLLEGLALTDALTGLPNRRAVEVWARRELEVAARHGFPFWVVMGDLDNFKSVNDTHGHDAGDAVLKRVGEILKDSTRTADTCGRLGGEEFVILLTHTNEEGARVAIERIREKVEAQRFRFGSESLAVTASFGIAGYTRLQSQNFSGLLAQADVALYSAKRLGRNRVEVAVTQAHSLTRPNKGRLEQGVSREDITQK